MAGLTAGYIEGRIMGCERGFQVNREVGFYAGIAKALLQEFSQKRQEDELHDNDSSTDDDDEEEQAQHIKKVTTNTATTTTTAGLSKRLVFLSII